MHFFVINRRGSWPQEAPFPHVILERDTWNDYGFETLFRSKLRLAHDYVVDLREVKILRRDQGVGRTPITEDFEFLDDNYCSLGQQLAYYESLLELSEDVRGEYLTALRDAATNPGIRHTFAQEPAFKTSLLRWGSAQRALEDAPAVFQGEEEIRRGFEFTFYTKLGSNEFATKFNFLSVEDLPGRINAIIGYNGTGKTKLLANLAWVAQADLECRKSGATVTKFGRLDQTELRFGWVLAVSYSAFDTFELPTHSEERNDFGYTYCGLRRNGDSENSSGLKDVENIADEIEDAMAKINTEERRGSLADALAPLKQEPSFKRAGYDLDVLLDGGPWREEFDHFSAGHKISINIIVQLVSALQYRSLVLIDEPESHLHPPLLAALMRGIHIALRSRRSYAVIATHSPVVLQEIAGRYARVLRRHGDQNFVSEPQIETFGENVGLLTRHVFNLDNSQSDYVGILRTLASKFEMEEMEELFPNGLSSEARVLVMKGIRS